MKLFKDNSEGRSAFLIVILSLERRWTFGKDNSFGEMPLYHEGWQKNSENNEDLLDLGSDYC